MTGCLKILNIKSTLVYVGKHVLIFFRHFVAHIRLIFIMHYGYQLWTCIVYISTLPFVFCLCTVATSSSRFQDIEDVFVIGCRNGHQLVGIKAGRCISDGYKTFIRMVYCQPKKFRFIEIFINRGQCHVWAPVLKALLL